jgi:putative transposase
MKFIAKKTNNGLITGKIALYCQVLKVSRQGFYNYLERRDRPWKYDALAAKMYEILDEDECNDTYGRYRMHHALEIKREAEGVEFPYIPHERTVYRIMEKLGMVHTPKRKPNGLTKADREAMKSDDKLKRDFTAKKPLEKCVTDITEIKTADGKLYVSAIEDCFDNAILGLSMAENMCASLCVETLRSALLAYPGLRGAIVHSDRGSQYTSEEYRQAVNKYTITQSMNSAGGRCHDNAKCESLWARFKEELLYGRYHTENMPMAEVKSLIWRYFMSYWNNRRICSANGGLPPMVKRKRYYDAVQAMVA